MRGFGGIVPTAVQGAACPPGRPRPLGKVGRAVRMQARGVIAVLHALAGPEALLWLRLAL